MANPFRAVMDAIARGADRLTGASRPLVDIPSLISQRSPLDKVFSQENTNPLRLIAPPPAIDRFPIIIGSNITLSYIAAASRLALTGYRQQYVDILSELLDVDPHAYACLSKRILTTAGGRLEVVPAECQDGDKDKAIELASMVRSQIEGIPFRSQRFASLLWGLWSGISGAEIEWERKPSEWRVSSLNFIHSRRLSFPNYGSWDVHIWDQGGVIGPGVNETGMTPLGLRVDDYPNKFIIHSPSLRGEYATREGLGRVLSVYIAIKRLVLRVSAQDFERFVKPWVLAYYSTKDKNGFGRAASELDIKAGDAAVKALGAGSLAGVTLPDSIKIEMLKAVTTLDQGDFNEFLDSAISKAALGQAHTMQSGKYGSRSTAEVGQDESTQIYKFDASCFCDTLKEYLCKPIVRLNAPGCEHLTPSVRIHVDAPDRGELMDLATKAAAANIHVDGDHVAETIGLRTIEAGDTTKRRMLPLSPQKSPEGADSVGSLSEIPSPTFQAEMRTSQAHRAMPGADDAMKAKIAKEIAAGTVSEVEMRDVEAEARAALPVDDA